MSVKISLNGWIDYYKKQVVNKLVESGGRPY